MAHLTHKLPWSSLLVEPREVRQEGRKAYAAKTARFLSSLASAIEEFAATDKRSDEEKAAYDVSQWPSGFTEPHALYGAGALTGFTTSVVDTYVTLNLLVADEARVRPALFGRPGYFLYEAVGFHDGCHPDEFAELLRPLVRHRRCAGGDSRFPATVLEPKELTPEVVDAIRRYCAELFRVMYTRPDVFTSECMTGTLANVFKRLRNSEAR